MFTGFLVTSTEAVMSVYMLFTNILPEAICCCLETCNGYVVLLTLFCIIMCTNFLGHYC